MKAAGLIGQGDDGAWAIRNGPSLADIKNESKAKAQLLGVEKRD